MTASSGRGSTGSALLLLGLFGLAEAGSAGTGRLLSQWMTRAPRIDGQISPGEWSETTAFDIAPGVSLRFGNDGRTLYLAVLDTGDFDLTNADVLGLLVDDEGGTPPVLDNNLWNSVCQQSPDLGEGAFLFYSSPPAVHFLEIVAEPNDCVQSVTSQVSFRSGVQPAQGVTYETAIPIDGQMPLHAGPGERFGVHVELGRDGIEIIDFPSSYTGPAAFRNLILASGGCNTGPQSFGQGGTRVGLPLDWTSEIVNGSGPSWIQSLTPSFGDPVFCRSNETGGSGAAACISNFYSTTPATESDLLMPLSLAGQASATVRARGRFVEDPGAFSEYLAFGLRRLDGTSEFPAIWSNDQLSTVDFALPLGGSPPVAIVFKHATFLGGGTAGGYAQVDDVELLCGPVIFTDGFESGLGTHWSAEVTPGFSCPAPTAGPTFHANTVLASATWTANTSPHIVTNNLVVPAGVTLTVAPCAEVRVAPASDLTIQGTLNAVGTRLQHITFSRNVASSPWDSIWIKSPGFAHLAYVDVSGGGLAGASVLVEGVDTLVPPVLPLRADHVTVTGSASYGVRLFRRAGFDAQSRELVVRGSGASDPSAPFPVRISLNLVGTLPTGSYTGNASDLIQVVGEGNQAVEVDDTFRNRGVPYQIGGPAGASGILEIDGDPTLATLTIDPGVELRFYTAGSNKGGLFVGTSGSPDVTGRIVAAGTAAAPIVFTGAGGAPVAGSWEGVTFFGALDLGNVLDHVQIDAAGYNGGDAGFGCPPAVYPATSGALKIFSEPLAQFLTNSTITRSSTHGVFRAWTGGTVDFLAGNTFFDVAYCQQVLPKPPLPVLCPVAPECPQ